MIEFDYKIDRNEADTIVTYTPEIKKELYNFISISGPNASGKSTLLNIIAISCYGLKNKTINDSLKKRMQALVDTEHQKLSFHVKISDRTGALQLLSVKDDDKSEVMIYENNKRITYEDFSRKYNLIYDIPEKPTERIKDLNIDLKERQLKIGNKLSSLSTYIRETINAINASKDPKKISELKDEREKLNDSFKELEKSKEYKEEELSILEKYYYCKYYLYYLNKYNEKNKEKDEILKNKRKTKKKNSKLAKEAREFVKKAGELLDEIKIDLDNLKHRSKNIAKDETKATLFYWEKLDLKEILFERDPTNCLIIGLTNLRVIFNKKIEEINSNADVDRANLLLGLCT